jgi:hypothetical protein
LIISLTVEQGVVCGCFIKKSYPEFSICASASANEIIPLGELLLQPNTVREESLFSPQDFLSARVNGSFFLRKNHLGRIRSYPDFQTEQFNLRLLWLERCEKPLMNIIYAHFIQKGLDSHASAGASVIPQLEQT